MPLYTYEHPETGETLDIVQGMNDQHIHIDEDGVKWSRVFHSPEASVDSSIDPFSNKAFIDKTGQSKSTMGELMDRSKEMSQRRKDKLGYDPVQKKYFENYKNQRRGVKHGLDNS